MLIVNENVNLDIFCDKYGFIYNPTNGPYDNMECYVKDDPDKKYSIRIYTVGCVMIKDNLNNDWYEDYDVIINFKEIKELVNDRILIKDSWEDN